jgi:hypothetical protein
MPPQRPQPVAPFSDEASASSAPPFSVHRIFARASARWPRVDLFQGRFHRINPARGSAPAIPGDRRCRKILSTLSPDRPIWAPYSSTPHRGSAQSARAHHCYFRFQLHDKTSNGVDSGGHGWPFVLPSEGTPSATVGWAVRVADQLFLSLPHLMPGVVLVVDLRKCRGLVKFAMRPTTSGVIRRRLPLRSPVKVPESYVGSTV